MKVITQGMVRVGAAVKKDDVLKLEAKYLKPGTHELDDAIAKELIDRGVAKRLGAGENKAGGDVRAQAKPQDSGGRA